MTTNPLVPDSAAAEVLERGLGRRAFVRAAVTVTAAGAMTAGGLGGASPAAGSQSSAARRARLPGQVLQPGVGPIDGDHYLPSRVEEVRWGYLPRTTDAPVLRMRSGRTVTIDALSHEGLLEDQGRDPVAYFASKGVPAAQVLRDGIDIARSYARHTRSFDVDGPHIVTGPIHVDGARPGDVLKVELLTALPRVPYGVISSRHGKGALSASFGGRPGDITAAEVMPGTVDGRSTKDPLKYGNVSVFTPIGKGRGGVASGFLPVGTRGTAAFPLDPFAGIMSVATVEDPVGPTDALLNSIPPTLGGGNIDINLLAVGSAFYLPVRAAGALFCVGDPHMAMGNGEVALTALEGSLRLTFRLTVCKPGSGDAPSVAFTYPFGETADAWVPIGLSDPDGSRNGQVSNLDIASRRAVVNALDFLQNDLGMDRAVAYAYLSAAADFEVSQVVDRTVGVHGVIAKAHFR